MRNSRTLFVLWLICCTLAIPKAGAQQRSGGVIIRDARHYSEAFGEVRNYRVFLPPGYDPARAKGYPVIYFFHGWSQRYFGSSNPYGDFDQGEDNGGDNIANFVAGHEVIVVKADGYNRSPDEPYYVRPYNVSPVETYRQFPAYFPELVNHIDTEYNTIPDRTQRAISGLSMGGFMTFWLSGKFPHLVSAAGNFCGSPEFMVGPKDFPVEYRHLDMYENYDGVNVRLHYGNKDFIRDYHRDLNAVWTQVMDNYSYGVYDAGHSTCGMGEMFSFIMETFRNPPARPSQWNHTDVYPRFSVWDYDVSTDRTVPGFTSLKNVDERGFRLAVRAFMPDGRTMPFVKVTVRTAPVYERNQTYHIHEIETATGHVTRQVVRSDDQGRITLHTNGADREIGINRPADKPNLALLGHVVEDGGWATHGKEISVSLRIVNKGNALVKNAKATITPVRSHTRVPVDRISFGDVPVNATATAATPFVFRTDIDSIAITRLRITLRDDRRNEWTDFLDIPLTPPAEEITDFVIADGRTFTVAKSGIDTETIRLGHGNGDGVANPGESIVLLVPDQGKQWRTALTFSDPHVNPFGTRVRGSDNWTSFDHVGASAKYDVPLIAADIPDGHTIAFHATWWLPEYPLHHERRAVLRVPVTGKDTTPPLVARVQATGDNVLHVAVIDGAGIHTVTATLVDEKDPKKRQSFSLHDSGDDGDPAAGDRVFSTVVPRQVFGMFRVIVEAEDVFGNRAVIESDNIHIFH